MDNTTITRRLQDHAAALEGHGHNLFRVRAYRKAAALVKMLPYSLSERFAAEGKKALEAVPGLGEHLVFTLENLLTTGDFRTLGPEAEPIDPERDLTSLPGVGPRLALRLKDELGVKTLDEVEQAARAGRLAKVGIGPKRLRGLLDALEGRRQRQLKAGSHEPSVADLLEVDRQFREKAARLGLRLASCRDGAPENSEIPAFQTTRGGWHFNAAFSDAPLAHRLGLTRDWVVVHFDNGDVRGRRTVVTETRNHLFGRRVVRGRERECQACWAS